MGVPTKGCVPACVKLTKHGYKVERSMRRQRGHALKVGYAWSLSDERASDLCAGDCHFCGQPAPLPLWSFVQRLDPGVAYVEGNCVTACKRCHVAKGRMSAVEFEETCRRVAAHRAT